MTKTILLVDDEEPILALMSATLGGGDRYCLLFASNGDEAIKVCQDVKPDLLFLDIMMPDLDGYEVCRSLKQNPSTTDIKIIMLTAMAQEFDRHKAVEVGADEYMTKPLSPTMLLERVEEILGVGRESGAGEF